MKISRKSEYAFLALVDLARFYPNKMRTISQLAETNDIPKKYLEQILILLKTAGLVKSIRGKQGGYILVKAPESITMADVVRLIDGAIASVRSVSTYFYEKTPLSTNDKILTVFKDIRDYASNILENTTINDLI